MNSHDHNMLHTGDSGSERFVTWALRITLACTNCREDAYRAVLDELTRYNACRDCMGAAMRDVALSVLFELYDSMPSTTKTAERYLEDRLARHLDETQTRV